jgi:hypothetical protein
MILQGGPRFGGNSVHACCHTAESPAALLIAFNVIAKQDRSLQGLNGSNRPLAAGDPRLSYGLSSHCRNNLSRLQDLLINFSFFATAIYHISQ